MRILLFILFATTGAYAAWTLLVWISIYAGFTPRMLQVYWIPIALITASGGLFTYFLACNSVSGLAQRGTVISSNFPSGQRHISKEKLLWFCLIGVLVSLILYWIEQNQIILWATLVISTAPLIGFYPGRHIQLKDIPIQLRRLDWLAIVIICVLVWLMHSYRGYGHPDDTHYLDAASSFLVESDYPLFGVDTIFQEYDRANLVYSLNLGQSWDAMVGYLAMVTGLNLHIVYYTLVPMMSALMFACVLMLFLKIAQIPLSALGFLIGVFVFYELHFGGSMAQAFIEGRLYHGKSALINIYIPLIFCVAFVHVRSSSHASLALMAIVLIATGGVSSTGLYLGPVAMGIALLSFQTPSFKNYLRAACTTAMVSLFCLGALLVFHVFRETKQVMVNFPYPDDLLLFKLGGDGQGQLQLLSYYLACVITIILALRLGHRVIARFAFGLLLLTLCPIIPEILGDLSGIMNLYWRYYWTMPLGLILVILSSLVCEISHRYAAHYPGIAPSFLLAILGLSIFSQTRIVQKVAFDNPKSTIRFTKIDKQVTQLMSYFDNYSGREIMIVAPPKTARKINLFPTAPKQLYVQPMYSQLIQSQVSKQYLADVQDIIDLISKNQLSLNDLELLSLKLAPFGVSHIVFLKSQLKALGEFDGFFVKCDEIKIFLICKIPKTGNDS